MNRFADLVKAEIFRSVSISLRYPGEGLASIVLSLLAFCVIFFGARHFAPNTVNLGNGVAGMVVSYFAWLLLAGAVGHTTSEIETESAAGTIVKLYASVHGLPTIIMARCIAGTIIAVSQASVALMLLLLITGTSINFDMRATAALLLLFASGLGFGLILGSITLCLKRTQLLFAPIYLLLLPLVFLDSSHWDEIYKRVFYILPGTSATALLKECLLSSPMDRSIVQTSILNAIAHLLIGYFAIKISVRRSRRLGIAAHS